MIMIMIMITCAVSFKGSSGSEETGVDLVWMAATYDLNRDCQLLLMGSYY